MENTNMESIQATNLGSTQDSNLSSKNYSFGWLVRHIRNVFMLRTGSRISIGEYFLANILLGIVAVVVMTVFMRLYRLLVNESASIGSINIFWILLGIIYLGFFIRQLILGAKRLKDLNMSPWWIVLGVSPLLILIGSFSGITMSLMSDSNSRIQLIVFASLGLIIAIAWFIIVIKMLFKKGTKGINKYGSDPLENQPTSNGKYWLLFLTFIIINILLSSVGGLDSSMERAMLRGAGFNQSQIEMMQNGLDIDTRNTLEDQMAPEDNTVNTSADARLADPSLSGTISDASTEQEISSNNTNTTEEKPMNDSTVTMNDAPTEKASPDSVLDDSTSVSQ